VISIGDETMISIEVTLWGNYALEFAGEFGNVFSAKSLKISDFNGCSLGTTMETTIEINPMKEESVKLSKWL